MERILDEAARRAEAAEVFELETLSKGVGFEANELKRVSEKEARGVGLRVIANGRLGHVSGSNLDVPETLAKKAVELAALGEEAGFAFAPASTHESLDLADPAVERLTIESMIETGRAAVDRLLAYDDGLKADVGFGTGFERIRIKNTAGADAQFVKRTVGFGVSASLVEGDNIVHLWKPVNSLKPLEDPLERVDALIEDMKVARRTVGMESGKVRAILTPVALADILMAFLPAVNGKAVAKGTSPLKDKIGQTILDPRFTLLDDGLHAEGVCSQPFDDEGLAVRRKPIVENGVLKTFIADLRTAPRIGIEPTGNGVREKPLEREKTFAAPPSPDVWNVVLGTGKTSYETMLKETELGLEIHSISGILLGNLINGDFSGMLEMAFRVEKGERVGRVKNVMVAGNFYSIFKDRLIDLEDRARWTGNFGGSSGAYLLPCAYVADLDAASRG